MGVGHRAEPCVSVITACGPDHPELLADAYRSLLAQDGPSWEWIVIHDGEVRPLPDGARTDGRVRTVSTGSRVGPAVARNYALQLSRAPRIQNLDADDMLAPDALKRLAAALDAQPRVGMAFGDADDWFPEQGRRVAFALPFRQGCIEPGALLARTDLAEDGTVSLPLHPAGVMWRREVLFGLGGWPALHGMEDTALVLAAQVRHASFYVAQTTLRYRRHSFQASRTVHQHSNRALQAQFIRSWMMALFEQSAVTHSDPSPRA